MVQDSASKQLASGVMDLLVLCSLSDGEGYGYEITQGLANAGLDDVSEATVYASVKRLEKNGLVRSRRELADNGRARRYYAIAAKGRAELRDRLRSWQQVVDVVGKVAAEHGVVE